MICKIKNFRFTHQSFKLAVRSCHPFFIKYWLPMKKTILYYLHLKECFEAIVRHVSIYNSWWMLLFINMLFSSWVLRPLPPFLFSSSWLQREEIANSISIPWAKISARWGHIGGRGRPEPDLHQVAWACFKVFFCIHLVSRNIQSQAVMTELQPAASSTMIAEKQATSMSVAEHTVLCRRNQMPLWIRAGGFPFYWL